MMRKVVLVFAVLISSLAVAPAAQACPMCKLANEDGTNSQAAAVANALPRAYMYSILFMLSMPAMLTTAFGLAFYRMHKRQQAEIMAAEATEGASTLLVEPAPA